MIRFKREPFLMYHNMRSIRLFPNPLGRRRRIPMKREKGDMCPMIGRVVEKGSLCWNSDPGEKKMEGKRHEQSC